MKKNIDFGLKIFLYLILLLLFLPLIQLIFEPIVIKGLQGAFTTTVKPKFSYDLWQKGTFQKQTSLYFNENTPFRPDFVRLKNQLNYWLFNEINTILTLGKENYIFDPNYIEARKGTDRLNDDNFLKKQQTLLQSKLILDSLNIPILFCFAPNKSNFYAEFLPEKTNQSNKTNQILFEKFFQKIGFPHINFDSYFLSEKERSPYPLVPKYGAHWTTYGAFLAAKILSNKINNLTNDENIIITLQSIELSPTAKFTDDDYLPSLNLISKWKSPEMAYPQLSFEVKRKPNVLIISDSFFWNFFDLNFVQTCFAKNSEMWYYNKTKYNYLKEIIGSKPEIIESNQLKNRDLIIVVSSDPGLKDLGYGFFEQLNLMHEK
jgi:hypothetical protein